MIRLLEMMQMVLEVPQLVQLVDMQRDGIDEPTMREQPLASNPNSCPFSKTITRPRKSTQAIRWLPFGPINLERETSLPWNVVICSKWWASGMMDGQLESE